LKIVTSDPRTFPSRAAIFSGCRRPSPPPHWVAPIACCFEALVQLLAKVARECAIDLDDRDENDRDHESDVAREELGPERESAHRSRLSGVSFVAQSITEPVDVSTASAHAPSLSRKRRTCVSTVRVLISPEVPQTSSRRFARENTRVGFSREHRDQFEFERAERDLLTVHVHAMKADVDFEAAPLQLCAGFVRGPRRLPFA
jgi:hypothetical protein